MSCVSFTVISEGRDNENDPLAKVVLPKRKKTLPVFVEEETMAGLLDNFGFSDDFAGIRRPYNNRASLSNRNEAVGTNRITGQ